MTGIGDHCASQNEKKLITLPFGHAQAMNGYHGSYDQNWKVRADTVGNAMMLGWLDSLRQPEMPPWLLLPADRRQSRRADERASGDCALGAGGAGLRFAWLASRSKCVLVSSPIQCHASCFCHASRTYMMHSYPCLCSCCRTSISSMCEPSVLIRAS